MENLLSLRRRSLSQPASVDPDLPLSASTDYSHSRPQLSISTSPSSTSTITLSPLDPNARPPLSPTAPAETGTLIRRLSTANQRLPSDHPLPLPPTSPHLISTSSSSSSSSSLSPSSSSDLSNSAFITTTPIRNDGASAAHSSQDLFWLPASLHPELAPQEFKAFIREQTRPDNLARRISSGSNGSSFGLGRIDRKKSMLRGEYKPRTDDGVGEGSDGERRTTSRLNFEELTISDLQRLEELAGKCELSF